MYVVQACIEQFVLGTIDLVVQKLSDSMFGSALANTVGKQVSTTLQPLRTSWNLSGFLQYGSDQGIPIDPPHTNKTRLRHRPLETLYSLFNLFQS